MTDSRRTAASVIALALALAFASCDATTDSDGVESGPTSSLAPSAPTTATETSVATTSESIAATSEEPTASEPQPSPPDTTEVTAETTSVATTIGDGGPLAPAELVACADAIPLRDRIALLVWPAVYSTDWDGALRTVGEHQVGGVVLMEPRGWGPDDLRDNLARLDEATERGLVIATDEEGGAVQRLSLLGELPSQQAVSEQLDPTEAAELIARHAESVADSGVDMVLGPVVDVVPVDGDVPLSRSRFFTGNANDVTTYAGAYVAGWTSAGLDAVLKHYPGHGGASGDTHDEQGVTAPLEDLEDWDLLPYAGLAGAGTAVMVGHLTVPGLTDGVPATQSPRAVDYLRNELGYGDALVLSDALGMQAVGVPEDEASVLAVRAGIDVVIFTATERTADVIAAIEGAVLDGSLSEARVTESAARVLGHLDPDRTRCGPDS